MPHVAKPTYTRAVPARAERCTHKGKSAVRWKGRNRQWVYGVLCENPARCLVECGKYHIRYRDHEGRPAREPGYSDKGASESLLGNRVIRSARIASGQLSPQAVAPRLPLSDLLAKWHQYIHDNGATENGAKCQYQRARDVCEGIDAQRVSDLSPAAVLGWLAERRRSPRFSAGTAANYLGSAKSFTRWCALVERCEAVDHLSALKRRREESDARIRRRALTPEELDTFLNATRESEADEFGLTPQERYALYLLACSTGLRAAELASLTRASFDVVRGDVTIQGKRAKNRRTEVLPVDAPVMRLVRPLFAGGNMLWPNRGKPSQAWWSRGAEMVRRDLDRAGIPAVVDGRVFDFHALRGQFATDLDRAGVTLTRAQKLMRHSTPVLTSKHYQKPDAPELAREVGKLKRGKRR